MADLRVYEKLDITCYQADDFLLEMEFFSDDDETPKDISGWTFYMEIRDGKDKTDTVVLNSTTNNFQFNVTGANNNIMSLVIPEAEIDIDGATYYYDIQIDDGTYTATIFKGKFVVESDVTDKINNF